MRALVAEAERLVRALLLRDPGLRRFYAAVVEVALYACEEDLSRGSAPLRQWTWPSLGGTVSPLPSRLDPVVAKLFSRHLQAQPVLWLDLAPAGSGAWWVRRWFAGPVHGQPLAEGAELHVRPAGAQLAVEVFDVLWREGVPEHPQRADTAARQGSWPVRRR